MGEKRTTVLPGGVLPLNEGLLQAVIDGIPDPVVVIGADFRVILMNRAALEQADSGSQGLCYQAMYQAGSPCSGPETPCPLESVRESLAPARVVHERLQANGRRRFFEVHAAPLLDENGRFMGIVESLRDITEFRQVKQRTQHLVHHDSLTGLPNRLLALDRLEQALLNARREEFYLAVALISLDRFNLVVGSLGHAPADQALIQVAERLVGCAAVGATVARTGSNEFMLLFPALSSVDQAGTIPKLIRAALRDPLGLLGEEIFLTASVGISVFPNDGQDGAILLRNAAVALQLAQRQGGDGYRMCSSDLNAATSRRLLLESDLRRAFERQEFLLHYQPLVNLETGQISGFETLLRWRNSDGKLIQPAEFIPVLENTGLILDVGKWVLQSVCHQRRLWQQLTNDSLRIAVNLSARQFKEPNLVAGVLRILNETGAAARWLELELTESLLMENIEGAVETMRKLRNSGIKISVDDFGTGYSSLAYLKRLPIDTLKIDRSFVAGTTTNSDDAVIVSMLIDMAHRFGLGVVAEGVETEAQLRFLRVHECDCVQGYLVGRPMPATDATRLLADGQRQQIG